MGTDDRWRVLPAMAQIQGVGPGEIKACLIYLFFTPVIPRILARVEKRLNYT